MVRFYIHVQENLKNVFVASSSLFLVIPLSTALVYETKTTFWIISILMISSFIHHLFESHQHGMRGFDCDIKISKLWVNIDILFVVVLFIDLFIETLIVWGRKGLDFKYFPSLFFIIPSIICWVLQYNKNKELQTRYIFSHYLWHFFISITLSQYIGFLEMSKHQ
jgi:hypothetical protein